MLALSPFQLADMTGETRSFSGKAQTIVCFIKEDCPTCREVMPVLVSMHEALAQHLEFLVVGQTIDGNRQ